MEKTVTFVIGATAAGKTTFIKNNFSDDKDTAVLNVYDYQKAAYKEAGYDKCKYIPFREEILCLHKANEALLADIIDALQQGESGHIVVEHTLYKAKRRIGYIDAIRKAQKNINIEVYIMRPSDPVWEAYAAERELADAFQRLKAEAEEIEFPNPSEGFDRIYEVVDNAVRPRMDDPKPEIVDTARKELAEEAEQRRKEREEIKAKADLLASMDTRPFWHYCEVCGTKLYCTAQEAFDAGWDYPPRMGTFGLLGPRTCNKCSMAFTLYWKVQQQEVPLVITKNLTEEELKTWRRIRNEPESLLEEEE